MAYEYERDEWRTAVRRSTELDRDIAVNAWRNAIGVIGDRTDDTDPSDDDSDEDDDVDD